MLIESDWDFIFIIDKYYEEILNLVCLMWINNYFKEMNF